MYYSIDGVLYFLCNETNKLYVLPDALTYNAKSGIIKYGIQKIKRINYHDYYIRYEESDEQYVTDEVISKLKKPCDTLHYVSEHSTSVTFDSDLNDDYLFTNKVFKYTYGGHNIMYEARHIKDDVNIKIYLINNKCLQHITKCKNFIYNGLMHHFIYCKLCTPDFDVINMLHEMYSTKCKLFDESKSEHKMVVNCINHFAAGEFMNKIVKVKPDQFININVAKNSDDNIFNRGFVMEYHANYQVYALHIFSKVYKSFESIVDDIEAKIYGIYDDYKFELFIDGSNIKLIYYVDSKDECKESYLSNYKNKTLNVRAPEIKSKYIDALCDILLKGDW